MFMKLLAFQCTFDAIIDKLSGRLRTIILVYYIVKFIEQSDAISDIYRINASIVRTTVLNVSDATQRIKCATYTLLVMFGFVIHTFLMLKWHKPKSFEIFHKTYSELYCVVYILSIITGVYSTTMLLSHCVFLLFLMRQTVEQFRAAVEEI